jgi:uncharacterized protein involved in tolerance to divalent cations
MTTIMHALSMRVLQNHRSAIDISRYVVNEKLKACLERAIQDGKDIN